MLRKSLMIALMIFATVSIFRCTDDSTTSEENTDNPSSTETLTTETERNTDSSSSITDAQPTTISVLSTESDTTTEFNLDAEIQRINEEVVDYCSVYTNVAESCIRLYGYYVQDFDKEVLFFEAYNELLNEKGYLYWDWYQLKDKMNLHLWALYKMNNEENAELMLTEYNELLSAYSLQAQADFTYVININADWTLHRWLALEPLTEELSAIADFLEPSGSVASKVADFYAAYRLLFPDPASSE